LSLRSQLSTEAKKLGVLKKLSLASRNDSSLTSPLSEGIL